MLFPPTGRRFWEIRIGPTLAECCDVMRSGLYLAIPAFEHPHQSAMEILHQMETICYLNRLRGADRSALGITAGSIARDDLDFRMIFEPRGQSLRVAVIQHVHRAMTLQIAQQCSISLATANGPVVDAKCMHRRSIRRWSSADSA